MSISILITGGAGFIGSNFVRFCLSKGLHPIVVDSFTYAGCPETLQIIEGEFGCNIQTHNLDINQTKDLLKILQTDRPKYVVNFAAESHVDRSIAGAASFVYTNFNGTFSLLNAFRDYFEAGSSDEQRTLRYLQISTDEVYGSLKKNEQSFSENSQYQPNNPYSATKAGADHLVRSFANTYKLPLLITNCSNNFGRFQHPEKLIPTIIRRALNRQPITIYGDGSNIRDWLHVDDHCDAVLTVLKRGTPGERYNIGGGSEISNIEITQIICTLLDELVPACSPYADLIEFVDDRKGHDFRYSINCDKIFQDLGWRAKRTFAEELRNVVTWNVENKAWTESALARSAS